MPHPISMGTLRRRIAIAKHNLDVARAHGDQLKIDLAENALNDLLDRLNVALVTRNNQREKAL